MNKWRMPVAVHTLPVAMIPREGWINWFSENPFEYDDMEWLVAHMKEDFAIHELRKHITKTGTI